MYSGDMTSVIMGGMVADHNRFQALKADLMLTHPDSPLNVKTRESTASKRILVGFGTSHPDAMFICTHSRYWHTPGTLPPDLSSKLDRGEIPLATLAVLAIGPQGMWFARYGNAFQANFNALAPSDKRELENVLLQLAGDTDPMSYQLAGVTAFHFGERGEVALVYNRGQAVTILPDRWPGPLRIMDVLQEGLLSSADQTLNDVAIGVGASVVVLGKGKPCPTFYSTHVPDFPPPDLREYMNKATGRPAMTRLALSVVNHEWWFAVCSDPANGVAFNGNFSARGERMFTEMFKEVQAQSVGSQYLILC